MAITWDNSGAPMGNVQMTDHKMVMADVPIGPDDPEHPEFVRPGEWHAYCSTCEWYVSIGYNPDQRLERKKAIEHAVSEHTGSPVWGGV